MNSQSKYILDVDFEVLDISVPFNVIEWFMQHVDRTDSVWHPEDEFADQLAARFHEAGYLSKEGEFSPDHTTRDALWVFEYAEWIIGRILASLERQHAIVVEWLEARFAEYEQLFEQYA